MSVSPLDETHEPGGPYEASPYSPTSHLTQQSTQHPTSPETTSATTPACAMNFEDIKQQISALVESSTMEKSAALVITRLFHGVECILQHERHTHIRKIAQLTHDMERAQMQFELDRLARRRILEDASQDTPSGQRRHSR